MGILLGGPAPALARATGRCDNSAMTQASTASEIQLPSVTSLTLTRPDDWHLHLRDGEALRTTVAHAAAQFGRALIMPNLRPPVTTARQALDYRQRILEAVPAGLAFDPVMSLYLTDRTPPEEIARAAEAGVRALKLYPAGATTNSDAGVTDLRLAYPTLEAMQKHGLLFLVHGEVTDPAVDLFDREAVFIERVMRPLRRDFPALNIVFEHVTTKHAAQYVAEAEGPIAATITAHHLLYNRNDIFKGGIRPHYYCLPVLKREEHRLALVTAATSGDERFFLGTDSAPHAQGAKEAACGCAGCYTALHAMELYAEAFERAGALDKLEAFASFNGPAFYNLPRNTDTITLKREQWTLPETLPMADQQVVPLNAGETINWKMV